MELPQTNTISGSSFNSDGSFHSSFKIVDMGTVLDFLKLKIQINNKDIVIVMSSPDLFDNELLEVFAKANCKITFIFPDYKQKSFFSSHPNPVEAFATFCQFCDKMKSHKHVIIMTVSFALYHNSFFLDNHWIMMPFLRGNRTVASNAYLFEIRRYSLTNLQNKIYEIAMQEQILVLKKAIVVSHLCFPSIPFDRNSFNAKTFLAHEKNFTVKQVSKIDNSRNMIGLEFGDMEPILQKLIMCANEITILAATGLKLMAILVLHPLELSKIKSIRIVIADLSSSVALSNYPKDLVDILPRQDYLISKLTKYPNVKIRRTKNVIFQSHIIVFNDDLQYCFINKYSYMRTSADSKYEMFVCLYDSPISKDNMFFISQYMLEFDEYWSSSVPLDKSISLEHRGCKSWPELGGIVDLSRYESDDNALFAI